ncbi:MAG: hypothetical protein H3C62_13010 [Gemmatimonadaceae bacterium]|nr:hypothetical protein [Gemmatimonadaceae bacterium]
MRIYVKRQDTGAIVHTVVVNNPTSSKCARVVRGLLRTMDTNVFCVDDHEADRVSTPGGP